MPVKIVGLDWRGGQYVHPFDVVNVPQRPGVYKLHYREPSGEWVVFYVGEAKTNLHEALVWPMTAAEVDPRIRARISTGNCAYSYAVVTDEEERQAALRSIYEHYKPELVDPKDIPNVETRLEVNPN